MGKKLYAPTQSGGIKFSSGRKPGEVRIPNYVYDLWLPLLGTDAMTVYAVYCRLEREDTVKSITLDTIAKCCRIGKATLYKVNKKLQECGFIVVKSPQGNARAHHHTTEITVNDPPREVAVNIIKKYQPDSGYEPLSKWLVGTPTDVPDRTSRSSEQNVQDVPTGTSTMLQPSGLQPSGVENKSREPKSRPIFEAVAKHAFEINDLKGLSTKSRNRIGLLEKVVRRVVATQIPGTTDYVAATLFSRFASAEKFKPSIQGESGLEIKFLSFLQNASNLQIVIPDAPLEIVPKLDTDEIPVMSPERVAEMKRIEAELLEKTNANSKPYDWRADLKKLTDKEAG